MVVRDIGFQKKEELIERLRQSPGEVAEKVPKVFADTLAPSRRTLRRLRGSLDWLAPYTLSGVHRVPFSVWFAYSLWACAAV